MAQVRFQARHDPLTGVGNRNLLFDRLDAAVRRYERSGVITAVMFLDLDGLKVVNDAHGHSAGDRLLVAIAGRLAAAVQPGDTVARLGGDEFVVLAEVAEPADAMLLAERLRVGVGEAMVLDGVATVSSTVSIGVTVATPGATTERLLHDADVALYRAKSRGKNRCELASSGAWPDVRFAE